MRTLGRHDLDRLLQLLPTALVLFREGRLVYANAACHKLLGLSDCAAIADAFEQMRLLAPKQPVWASSSDCLAAAMKNGANDARLELELQMPDGRLFPACFSFQALQQDDEIWVLLLIQDITQQRNLEQKLQISENRLNESQRIAKVGSWSLDLVKNELYWSDQIYELFEIDKEKLNASYEGFLEVIHPDDRGLVNDSYTRSLRNRQPYQVDHRLLLNGRRIKYVREACETMFDEDGRPLVSRGTVQDITAEVEAAATLKLYANVFRHSPDAIMITDSENHIVSVNNTLLDMTGYAEQELIAQSARKLSEEITLAKKNQQISQSLDETGRWQGELPGKRKDGSVFPKDLSITEVSDSDGKVSHYIHIFTDISERKIAEERIAHLAHYDPLTGLTNRYSFEERLKQAISEAQRSSDQLALLYVDLDRFKQVNDSFGHVAGDFVLKQVATRLRCAARRNSDIIARIGGDEFVVVLTQVGGGARTAALAARKLVDNLAQPYNFEGVELKVSPSIGISVFPGDGKDADMLLNHADKAMYRVKEQGRSNFHFFTQKMNEEVQEAVELERDIRIALSSNRLELHYQPKIQVATGRANGVEALLRWYHPQKGYISPARLIPVLEQTNQIVQVGNWVLDQALQQVSKWRKLNVDDVSVAINVSARQFRQEAFFQRIREALDFHQLVPADVELEITETAAMEEPEQVIAHFEELRDLGIELTIDDFGTGYSSLARLKTFPIQKLKLDRTFVMNMENDENDRAICLASLSLAHNLGLEVVAEGVENDAQSRFLIANHCDYLQGYFYSRPLDAEAATRYLLDR